MELSGFRIARRPVTNAEYLAFMAAGGYERQELWTDAGRHWLAQGRDTAPWQWRSDPAGHWFEAASVHSKSKYVCQDSKGFASITGVFLRTARRVFAVPWDSVVLRRTFFLTTFFFSGTRRR